MKPIIQLTLLGIGLLLISSGCASLRPPTAQETYYQSKQKESADKETLLEPEWAFVNFIGGFWPKDATVKP